jgi:hypothetical protein
MKKILLLAAFPTVLVLASCGGGGDSPLSELDTLRAQALAKETEARALAVDQPCLTDSQCAVLDLGPTNNNCIQVTAKAYSKVSPTATQAEVAASEQRVLAARVMNLLPATVCPPIAPAPARCEAQKCVTTP